MKYRLNLSIDAELYHELKARQVNVSQLVNDYLRTYLDIEENKEGDKTLTHNILRKQAELIKLQAEQKKREAEQKKKAKRYVEVKSSESF